MLSAWLQTTKYILQKEKNKDHTNSFCSGTKPPEFVLTTALLLNYPDILVQLLSDGSKIR